MNKLIIALSIVCASAYAFGAQKISTNDWFSASAESGSDVVTGTGASWAGTARTIVNKKYVLKSEIGSPVTFNSGTAAVEGDFTEVSFKFDTAIVPAAALDSQLGARSPNAKIAFAASEDGEARAYYAWLGATTGWRKLAGATPSAVDGAPYVLFVTFDKTKENRVQFRIGGTALYLAGGLAEETWISYDAPVSTTCVAIDFVGSGNLAYLKGNQQVIEAEIIVDGGVKVNIKEADVEKFNLGQQTPAEFFASPAKGKIDGFTAEGITVATAYALGLIVDEGGTMTAVDGGHLMASAVAESTDTATITFAMNAEARDAKDTGVFVRYQVVNETVGGNPTPGLTIQKPGKVGFMKYKVRAVLTNVAPDSAD